MLQILKWGDSWTCGKLRERGTISFLITYPKSITIKKKNWWHDLGIVLSKLKDSLRVDVLEIEKRKR